MTSKLQFKVSTTESRGLSATAELVYSCRREPLRFHFTWMCLSNNVGRPTGGVLLSADLEHKSNSFLKKSWRCGSTTEIFEA